MARQATNPVAHVRTIRADESILMTSGRAGKVLPIAYIPLLRGDSAAGRIGIDVELAEMPRPLQNGVTGNMQAWFIPKSSHPRFTGLDEFMHSYVGEPIKSPGVADRTPPPFYTLIEGAAVATAAASDFFKTLGIHVPSGAKINTDLIDAFVLAYNFRLAAHSSRLTRKDYAGENLGNALALPRAFWPTGRFSRVVPDYERALILGDLDLDVAAGLIPLSVAAKNVTLKANTIGQQMRSRTTGALLTSAPWGTNATDANGILRINAGDARLDPNGSLEVALNDVYANMSGQSIGVTLADIDKARTTQAFAKLRAAYAGNDTTGFNNDDAIIATLMQGLNVPEDQFRRPWLLDQKRVAFGFAERHATDAANLDKSVSQGRASAVLSLNVPQVDSGGYIIVTLEVLPERLEERQTDEALLIETVDALPNALRDIQRPEPVDLVKNRRLDALHSTPNGLYGYEPMNDVWNRQFTRLGGAFYQADPANPWTEQRSAIWQASIVNPAFTSDHFLAPATFPHYVFSDTAAPAFEVVARHSVKINGLTQIGDVLHENNDDYAAVQATA